MESSIPKTTVKALAEKYEYFCLDCDGVIWSGNKPIDQSIEVINWLHSIGKKLFFISNSSGKTREEYKLRLQKLGYKECHESQIYGSAYITARYISEKYPEISNVRVVGMNSIRKELAE